MEAHMIKHTIKTGILIIGEKEHKQLQRKQKNECGAKLIHDLIISHMEPKQTGGENITNPSAS